jgi:transcriptional antiterminator NusG
MNFFAMQIMTGMEDAYVELLSKTNPDIELFVIKKTIRSRKKGKVVTLINRVFPGYVFFQHPDEELPAILIRTLKRTRNFVRILPDTRAIKPLNARDSDLLHHLVSFGQSIGTSLVTFDENNRIKILKGPLMGLEGMIVKVDKRKRRAKIRLDMNDSPIMFDLGFEVLKIAEKGEH